MHATCWRIFCLFLVHSLHSAVMRTKTDQTNAWRWYGSTQTGHGRLVHSARGNHGAGHACRVRLSGAGHGPQEEPGECAGQDPRGLLRVHRGVLCGGLQRGLRHAFLRGGRHPGPAKRLFAGQVLLSAHLRGGHSGHRLGRDCRAGEVLAAADRHRGHRRLRLPVFRGHRLEPALRRSGLDQVADRRGVP